MTTEIQNLLNQIGLVLKHHSEIQKIKGESFNVFSVLKMETRENSTHSALLAELLNPQGSHLKGSLFLCLFFKTLRVSIEESEDPFELKPFDIDTAKIYVEKKIGDRNDKELTGGRVDIYLIDNNGNSICIENKINAVDQHAQIQRYYNHNREKNIVLYLNLDGSNPSEISMQKLKANKDFYIISYRDHIISWLLDCQKETVDQPILRETIKQYIILVQKLTNTMSDQMNNEINNLIFRHFKESELISKNFESAQFELCKGIRDEIISGFKEKLDNKFKIKLHRKIEDPLSKILIQLTESSEDKLKFCLQNFSPLRSEGIRNNLFIGILVHGGKYLPEYEILGEKYSNYWLGIEEIKPEYRNEQYDSNFRNKETLIKLYNEAEFRENMVNAVIDYTINYINRKVEDIEPLL